MERGSNTRGDRVPILSHAIPLFLFFLCYFHRMGRAGLWISNERSHFPLLFPVLFPGRREERVVECSRDEERATSNSDSRTSSLMILTRAS